MTKGVALLLSIVVIVIINFTAGRIGFIIGWNNLFSTNVLEDETCH